MQVKQAQYMYDSVMTAVLCFINPKTILHESFFAT